LLFFATIVLLLAHLIVTYTPPSPVQKEPIFIIEPVCDEEPIVGIEKPEMQVDEPIKESEIDPCVFSSFHYYSSDCPIATFPAI